MSDYSASALEVLEGLEPVRKRPGMYIGSTDSRGLNHLVWEIVDNAVDEALAGHADTIDIHLMADGGIAVADNGRGIPTDVNAKTGLAGPILVFTKLHAGGKFGGDESGYKVSGGLHGVGASVVNALSERVDVEVCRDGKLHAISFQRGEPGHFDGAGEFTPGTDMAVSKSPKGRQTGTTVRYWADMPLFHADAKIDPAKVLERARQTAFLVPGLTLNVTDELSEVPASESFRYDGGSADFVEFLSTGEPVSPILSFAGESGYTETIRVYEGQTMVTKDVDRVIEIDTSMMWTSGYDTNIRSFANIVATPKGGKHVEGFEAAVAKAVRDAIDEQGITTKKEQNDDKYAISKDDVLEGVTAVVMVRLPEPQFEGQTKEVLGTPEARTAVYQTVKDQLSDWLAAKKNRTQARAILKKVADAMRARLAARAQRETVRRKQALESSTLPAKLADCRTHDLELSEIFLVEGDSAMGCLDGNTRVNLADGTTKSMRELADDWEEGLTHFGYAADPAGDVHVVPLLHPRVTNTDAPLVDVELDNGETITCTPCHRFLLRDGSYLRADRLEPGQSLMPLYRRHSDKATERIGGYEMTWQNGSSEWVFTHHLAEQGCLDADDPAEAYDALRGKTAPKFTTLAANHFDGDEDALLEAAANHNHKVVAVRHLDETADVYDLTVDVHHNFALEAGVFVHNSAKSARNSEYQALLPLRGKILNTVRANEKRMLENAECSAIITALGAGSGASFTADALRYGKVILLMDADVDGAHIRALLLALFHEYLRPLLEEGRVFSAQPPLFKVEEAGSGGQKGNIHYCYDDAEKERVVAKLEKAGKKIKGIQRYKGLGEMNADQLADTTMERDKRVLRRITLEDAERAAEVFQTTMGPKVAPRREFIEAASQVIDRDMLDV